jgi:hypothetical protein
MRRLFAIACVAMVLPGAANAQPKENWPPAHANRETAVALLRQEGILHGKTRVASAQWTGDFWLIRLRHPDGIVSNWTVDARAENYTYVCKH